MSSYDAFLSSSSQPANSNIVLLKQPDPRNAGSAHRKTVFGILEPHPAQGQNRDFVLAGRSETNQALPPGRFVFLLKHWTKDHEIRPLGSCTAYFLWGMAG